MPTGYTVYIEDGKITTGKDFLKLCARAFGIAIDQKDESLDTPLKTEFKPNQWYIDAYYNACKSLDDAKKMTFDEAKLELETNYKEQNERNKRLLNSLYHRRKKYKRVRREVKTWTPPTEEHVNLKTFALEQIDMCIPSVEQIKNCISDIRKPLDLSTEAIMQYINDNISYCKDSVDYYKKIMSEEFDRVKEKQEWMDKFLESLEII